MSAMSDRSPNPVRRPSTTSSQDSRDSSETYESMSTAPSSIHGGNTPQCPQEPTGSWSRPPPPSPARLAPPQPQTQIHFRSSATAASEDISPGTSLCPRDSFETYDSKMDSEMEDEDEDDLADDDADMSLDDDVSGDGNKCPPKRIPILPAYLRQPENDVIASNPQTFARLFPSMDRLVIRHDDLTPDGNMNLRVDTIVPGNGRHRHSSIVQLFHLRMHDLDRREFSFRRYCRDSGREVCKSKRKFNDSVASASSTSLCADKPQGAEARRPSITRSVSSALKVLAPRPGIASRRPSAASVLFGGVGRSNTGSSYEADDESTAAASSSASPAEIKIAAARAAAPRPPVPTNTIKLEFSNYARVDISRCGAGSSKRYEFEWWGHNYAWKRVVDRNVEGVVSFHLIRDGQGAPVAHIVPESRTPTQIRDEEGAGGWIPPCFMWISDASILNAVTDVADVVVSTGLMALVDDCIKERWQDGEKPKARRTSAFGSLEVGSPKALMQHFFGGRRHSYQPASPLRLVNSTY